ncbi:MAG: hypothetical protein EWM72_02495 [Nitrospira sp.]|nr:MAG: hypothetical protein EWM72_02495 [Nitrospira sp.]
MEATATVLSNLYLLTHFEPSVIENVTTMMGAPSHPNLPLWNPWSAILAAPLRIGNRPIGMIDSDGRPLPSRSNRKNTRPSCCSIKSNHAEHESVGGSPVTNRQGSRTYFAVRVSRVPGTHSSRFQLFRTFSSLKVNVYR